MADEMGADWDDGENRTRPKAMRSKYGNQDTDGSRSMRHHIQSMRQMGASRAPHAGGRLRLRNAGVDVSTVQVGVHEVTVRVEQGLWIW